MTTRKSKEKIVFTQKNIQECKKNRLEWEYEKQSSTLTINKYSNEGKPIGSYLFTQEEGYALIKLLGNWSTSYLWPRLEGENK